jgi:hypothetical protein
VSVRWAGHGLLAEHPVGGRCRQAGKLGAALAAVMHSPVQQGAGFPARAAVAWEDEDCRSAPSPWVVGWGTARTPAGGVPSQRAV